MLTRPVASVPSGEIVRYAMHPALVGITGDIDAMSLYAGLGVASTTEVESAGEIVTRFAAALTP